MGLEQTVTFPENRVPTWHAVHELLAKHGLSVQVRMIDGAPAYPDEVPAEPWSELRVGAAAGIVTLRRGPDRVTIVTWGNAEKPLLQLRNALAWAFAETGAGHIDSGQGEQDAIEFRKTADLPAEFRGDFDQLAD